MAMRTRVASYTLTLTSLSLQTKVRPQQRRPARMVLLVERQVAAAIGGVHRSRDGGAGAAAQVGDRRRRREQHAAAARADRRAEIHILGVEEVALVEQAGRFGVGAMDQQRRAADPVHVTLLRRRSV